MGPLRNKLRRSRRSTPESNTSSLGHMAQSTVVSTDTDVVNGQRFASFIKLDGKNNQTMLFLEVLREEVCLISGSERTFFEKGTRSSTQQPH
jgi:hypothetical protein